MKKIILAVMVGGALALSGCNQGGTGDPYGTGSSGGSGGYNQGSSGATNRGSGMQQNQSGGANQNSTGQ